MASTPPAAVRLHVFLVDEHEIVRLGVQAAIESTDDIDVVGHADTVRGALLRIPTVRPDVVVVGMLFDISNGVELCRELVDRSGSRVLMLAHSDDATMVSAFLAGAAGYVDKSIRKAALLDAIRTTAGGGTLLNPTAAAAVMQRLRNPTPPPTSLFEALNEREHEVLALIGEGLSNRQIAERMFVAEKTVKNYVSRILTKMDMSSRTQVAVALVHEQEG